MYSKVKIFGHPVHPMLVAFPITLYTAAMVCYIVYNNNADMFWFKAGLAANIAGVCMAVLAALPGFIDWLNIPSDTKPKRTGVTHLVFNVLALALFAINAAMLYNEWNDTTPQLYYALPLTIAGFVCTLVAGFMGWTLVQTHHVGVDEPRETIRTEREERMAGSELGQQPQWKAASGDSRTDTDQGR
ncbi:MAG: DUF2231 domain-containing protein [Flavisolibacter sp.]|nr:DUF2231 domain-containing protein [Flavisolibacter sp.]